MSSGRNYDPLAYLLGLMGVGTTGYNYYTRAMRTPGGKIAQKAALAASKQAYRTTKKMLTSNGGRKRKRGRGKKPPTTKNLNRKVKKLARRVEGQMGTLVWRKRQLQQLSSSVSQGAMYGYAAVSTSAIEASLAAMPIFDPSTPATLHSADFTSGSYNKQIEFASVSSYAKIHNNYNYPVHVTVYICYNKLDTSIAPVTTVDNGLADVGTSLGSTTLMISPKDSPQFRDVYRVKKQMSKKLNPGDSCYMKNKSKSFMYDPSFTDNHSSSYQVAHGAHHILVHIKGVLAHDAATSNLFAHAVAKVDIEFGHQYVIKYEAGADLLHYIINDDQDTLTGGSKIWYKTDPTGETLVTY